jgi:inorganic pyrophosphatase
MLTRRSGAPGEPEGILARMADVALHCRVEIPKGSRNKYEWDERLGGIRLDRFLFSSVVFPTDYGFFPNTLAEDGGPLDVMVCVSAPTFPGCIIPVKAIALFRMSADKGQDDKVLCVPHEDPNWNHMERLDDLPSQLRLEIEHFFSIYKEPEGKRVEVGGWYDRDEADAVIESSRRRFSENEGGDA